MKNKKWITVNSYSWTKDFKEFTKKHERFFLNVLITVVVICIYIANIETAYAMTPEPEENILDGTTRVPLLQPGQDLDSLEPGIYPVTGGTIEVGFMGKQGSILKILEIGVNGPRAQGNIYDPSNNEYNLNFSRVLFEMREAGYSRANARNMDYWSLITEQQHPHLEYLNSFRATMGHSSQNYIAITNRLLSELAVQYYR